MELCLHMCHPCWHYVSSAHTCPLLAITKAA